MMPRRVIPRRCQVLLIFTVGVTSLFFVTRLPQDAPTPEILAHPYFRYNFSDEGPEDPAQVCVIPRFHPFHPTVWRYITQPRPISCIARHESFTYVDDYGWLRLNLTAVEGANYCVDCNKILRKITCQWRVVLRGGSDHTDDDTVSYGEEKALTTHGVALSRIEIVSVVCRNFAGLSIYETVHSNIRNISLSMLKRDPNSRTSVLIFGLDSMSRLAFIRLLPNTYRYLTQTLSMTVFTGMNKIGDNTFPNLIALLTGKKAYGPDLPDEKDGFDDWPLIWRNYSTSGYATLWAEDFPEFSLFNYLAKGFRHPPVHHYLRPFWLAVKESSTLRTSSHMCYGNKARHMLQLDYVRRFIMKYSKRANNTGVPYFAFTFLAELSHDYQSKIAAADADFEQFFRFLNDGGHLKNTVVMVMSDHGHRFDAIRTTQVGRMEERLPFFAMSVPERLVLSNPFILYHLKINKGRLTTPYDIHATLVDLLQHGLANKILGFQTSSLGTTLFGGISPNRTCKDAGIPTHYCTCQPETPISVDDLRVRAAVRSVFNRINKILRTVRDFCVELVPGTVLNAQILNSASDKMNIVQVKDWIRITVRALPSEGIFEATVEVTTKEKETKGKVKRTGSLPYEGRVLGDVSRINMYGNQSSCIKHDILRKYCYCQQKLTVPPIRHTKLTLRLKRVP